MNPSSDMLASNWPSMCFLQSAADWYFDVKSEIEKRLLWSTSRILLTWLSPIFDVVCARTVASVLLASWVDFTIPGSAAWLFGWSVLALWSGWLMTGWCSALTSWSGKFGMLSAGTRDAFPPNLFGIGLDTDCRLERWCPRLCLLLEQAAIWISSPVAFADLKLQFLFGHFIAATVKSNPAAVPTAAARRPIEYDYCILVC